MDEDNNQVDPKTGLRGWEEGREEKGREGATVGAMHDACTMHARTRQQKNEEKKTINPEACSICSRGHWKRTMNEEVNVAAAVGYAKERRANAALALPVAG